MSTVTVVDTHIHLWDLSKLYYDWLTDKIVIDDVLGDYSPICNRNYLPEQFVGDLPVGEEVIAVHLDCALGQADPVDETKWLARQAKIHNWIGAIVGRADLTNAHVDELLDRHLAASDRFRGVRMFSTAEVWGTTQFKNGMRALRARNLSFDLDADADTMPAAAEMANACNQTQIILGHAGFPKRRTKEYFERWRASMEILARCENVTCKISGLGMADHNWTQETIRPWVEACLDCFGIDRCMFGTNWPVDSLYSDYTAVLMAYREILSAFSQEEQQKFFCTNAIKYYSIGKELPINRAERR